MKEKVPVMKHIFILNPAAGKSDQTPRFTQDIERICGARGLDYEICVSKAPGDCRALARRAAESGQEVRLYACVLVILLSAGRSGPWDRKSAGPLA